MGFFGNNDSTLVRELFVPVSPKSAFDALLEVAQTDYNLKSSDDFTMAVNFTSGASALTWGESFAAQVIPTGENATIRITVAGKVGGQIQQAAKNQKQLDLVFGSVTEILRNQSQK